MTTDPNLQPSDDLGADVTDDSPLPDIPDAGDDSVPLVPPQPIDISTATLSTDGALVASTFGDPRTLYEQAIDAYEANDPDSVSRVPLEPDLDPNAAADADTTAHTPPTTSGHARIYDSDQ